MQRPLDVAQVTNINDTNAYMILLPTHKLKTKAFISFVLLISSTIFVQSVNAAAPVKPINLRTEYLVNPLGLENAHPRLTWMLDDNRHGAKQTAFQVIVGTDSMAVSRGAGSMWATPKVNSSNILATYQGKVLQPYTKYFWKVDVWDKSGVKGASSGVSSFEMGVMKMTNWKGSWISDEQGVNVKPAPYFRTTFGTGKKVKTARAYIAVAGLYELYINGEKIGNHRLDPMYTRFDRRTLYVTYDVTKNIMAGKNAIGVLLGNGWYNHPKHRRLGFRQGIVA